jgi:RimJ/RimL family protein N-acetyltransferase
MSDLELMEIQTETLFSFDGNGCLRCVNEPGEPPPPCFFLGRTKSGNVWRLRYDLPDDIVGKLGTLAASEPVASDLRRKPINFDAFVDALKAHAEVKKVWMGPAYRFPDEVKSPANVVMITEANAKLLGFGFSDLIPMLETREPCVAVVEGGVAVSVCFSSRVSRWAAEAGVETLEGFRGRGYATSVVAGWAVAVRQLGLTPLYSTSWDNLASQGVARRLGLMLYGVDLSFT